MSVNKSKRCVLKAMDRLHQADTAVEAVVTTTMRGQQDRDTQVAASEEVEAITVVEADIMVDMVDAIEETMVEIDVQAAAEVIIDPTMTKDGAGTVVMEAVTEDTTDELTPRNELLKVSKQHYTKRSTKLIIIFFQTLNFFKHKNFTFSFLF